MTRHIPGASKITGTVRLISRLHSHLTLNQWDRVTALVATTLLTISVPVMAVLGPFSSAVLAIGGSVVLWRHFVDLRLFDETMWVLASNTEDPLAVVSLFDFMRHLRFGDLVVLVDWSANHDLDALLRGKIDPETVPAPVLALAEHLRT